MAILKSELTEILNKVFHIKRISYQKWPIHVLAQAGFVFRKAGELMRAAEEFKYDRAESVEDQKAQHEAMVNYTYETMAVCLRFLERLRPFDTPTTTKAGDSPAETEQLPLPLDYVDMKDILAVEIGKEPIPHTQDELRALYERKEGEGIIVYTDNGTETVPVAVGGGIAAAFDPDLLEEQPSVLVTPTTEGTLQIQTDISVIDEHPRHINFSSPEHARTREDIDPKIFE